MLTRVTFANTLVLAVVIVGAAGFLLGMIHWQEYLGGIGVSVGFASGHGLSPDTDAPDATGSGR